VLLADEPTAEVDAATESDLIRLLAESCATGAAVVVATHSAALAEATARVIRLRDGRIVDDAGRR
jgi:putative ABC transport system ATP-binding protein